MATAQVWDITYVVSSRPCADDVSSRGKNVNRSPIIGVGRSEIVDSDCPDGSHSRSTSGGVVASIVGAISSCNSNMDSTVYELCKHMG